MTDLGHHAALRARLGAAAGLAAAGIAVCVLGGPGLGGPITAGSLLVFVHSIHAYGRAGPERTRPRRRRR